MRNHNMLQINRCKTLKAIQLKNFIMEKLIFFIFGPKMKNKFEKNICRRFFDELCVFTDGKNVKSESWYKRMFQNFVLLVFNLNLMRFHVGRKPFFFILKKESIYLLWIVGKLSFSIKCFFSFLWLTTFFEIHLHGDQHTLKLRPGGGVKFQKWSRCATMIFW